MTEPRQTVLVVDDNELNRDLLARRLERAGYQVVTAADGHTALEIVSRELVDIVILDIMMPEMSGFEVVSRIRASQATQSVPIIMASARTDGSDVVRALDEGANDYVTKPIDIDVLLARMRVHTRKPSARSSARPSHGFVGPGTVLDDKYRLEAQLGSGGFGAVFKGMHLGLERPVAIKVLHAELLESEAAVRRFAREGVSACRVKHRNAVAVLDAGCTTSGVPYLVMEYLEGVTLHALLEREKVLRLQRTVEIAKPICDVLVTAHKAGIVHRDIKPGNVLLCKEEQGELVKVVDFGLAQLVDHPSQSMGDIAGTPHYMAPERLLGRPSDATSDTYSVGVLLYRMLSGRFPFGALTSNPFEGVLRQLAEPATPLRDARPDLPEEVCAAVMLALASDPGARVPLAELRDTLARNAESWTEPKWPLDALSQPPAPEQPTTSSAPDASERRAKDPLSGELPTAGGIKRREP
jgi:serine/threonine protein kinase